MRVGLRPALQIADDLHARFCPRAVFDGAGDAGSRRRIAELFAAQEHLLALPAALLFRHGAFRNDDDVVARPVFAAAGDIFRKRRLIVRKFGQNAGVRPARDGGIEGEPARLVAHDLDEDGPAVAVCGGVHLAHALCSDLRRRIEPEGEFRTPDIVVDGLGQPDDVAALGREHGSRLVRARAAQRYKAVEPQTAVVFYHFIELGNAVFRRVRHVLEGLTDAA